MSRLERWLPFKFRRNKAKKGSEEEAEKTPRGAMTQWLGGQMMERMFSEPWWRDPFARFADMERWFGDFTPTRFSPNIDVVDEEAALRVTAELPGMSADDVKVQVENDMLVISGEKRNEDEKKEDGAYRTERFYGYFKRTVPLPGELDFDKIDAKFDKGVLSVTLPKVPGKAKASKTIPVK